MLVNYIGKSLKALSVVLLGLTLIACNPQDLVGGIEEENNAPADASLFSSDLTIKDVSVSSEPMPTATRQDSGGTFTIVGMPDGRTAIETRTTYTGSPIVSVHLYIDGQHLVKDNTPSTEITINVCDEVAAQTGYTCTADCISAANNISNCRGSDGQDPTQLTNTIQGVVASSCSISKAQGLWPDANGLFGNTADEYVFKVFFTGFPEYGFPGILTGGGYSGVTCDTSCDKVTYVYWENSPGTGPVITDPGVILSHADGTHTQIPGSGSYRLDGVTQVRRDSVSCN